MSINHAAEPGNLVFIILTIAYVIYSFYRKAQKANKAKYPQPQAEQSNPGKKLSDWMEEVFADEEVKQPPVPPVIPEVEIPFSREKGFDIQYPKPFLEEEMKLYKGGEYAETKMAPIEDEVKQMPEPREETSILNEIDLKKAILYSEILRRPYH